MQSFLVTGGMGFVGSHLCERLLQQGKEVWALDLYDTAHAQRLTAYPNYHRVVDSIKNLPVLQKLVDRVDVVCHLAAIACPEEYLRRPRKVMDITMMAALDLIEMVRLTGKRFFFTSTSEIYGKSEKVPFVEDDDRILGSTEVRRWCYSTSKAAVEHYLKACHFEGQLDYLIVRLFNIYGPRLRGRVVSRYVDAALQGQPLIVHGSGNQTRCFTYVDDAIEAFIALMESPEAWNGSYNVGTTTETKISDLARIVLEVSGSPSELSFVSHEQALGKSYEDVSRRVPEISRIEDTIGWKPTTSLRVGLDRMIRQRRSELTEGGILDVAPPVTGALVGAES